VVLGRGRPKSPGGDECPSQYHFLDPLEGPKCTGEFFFFFLIRLFMLCSYFCFLFLFNVCFYYLFCLLIVILF
jgi:hypothetical protein